MPSPWVTRMNRRLAEDELRELRARLAPGATDHLGVLERIADRRATRARIAELEQEMGLPVSPIPAKALS